jgi:hypothetical protein
MRTECGVCHRAGPCEHEDDGDVWTPEQRARVQRGMEAMREPVKDADEVLNVMISLAYTCGRYNSGGQPMPQDAAALVEARSAVRARMVHTPVTPVALEAAFVGVTAFWPTREQCAAALAKLKGEK